jgi:uncharacterized SAM-binding protein YcdF (DUF218 family)
MTYTQPLLLLFAAIALTGLLRTRASRPKHIALCGLAGLLLLSWPPVDWLLGLPLEGRYPVRPFRPPPGIQAIVVLGSTVQPSIYERPYPIPDCDTYNRCEHASWIYRRWGPFPVLACEGQQRTPGMTVMADLLRRAGVPENMIWIEKRSRSTRENAAYGAAVLRQHGIQRIVLVVEAQSMLRASACFRKEGIDVTAAPSEFRTLGPWREELLPSWRAVRRNEVTLHEALGLAWYRLHGWI